jgi:hypothetical protein
MPALSHPALPTTHSCAARVMTRVMHVGTEQGATAKDENTMRTLLNHIRPPSCRLSLVGDSVTRSMALSHADSCECYTLCTLTRSHAALNRCPFTSVRERRTLLFVCLPSGHARRVGRRLLRFSARGLACARLQLWRCTRFTPRPHATQPAHKSIPGCKSHSSHCVVSLFPRHTNHFTWKWFTELLLLATS